ncbi:putative phosphoglycerate kinase [Bacteroides xylanisolvens]|nr:putative phosphoglycerate kinase [Bacteroides xylanisolvens]
MGLLHENHRPRQIRRIERTVRMNKQTIYDLKPEGKTIYIRVDYNVPHDKEGHITDDRRIVATLPTLRCSSLRAIWAVQRAK